MSRVEVRTRSGVYLAELDDSEFSNAMWMSLPREGTANVWGNEIYFEMPGEVTVQGDVTVLESGDVAYWPQGKAICLFFGSTPLSEEDGRPVSAYPVKKIGRLLGDYSGLEDVGDRTRVVLERTF